MLITKEVILKWHNSTRKYYESLGYKFTKYGDEFVVKIEHLTKGNGVLIDIQCDYCDEKFQRKYWEHHRCLKESYTKKDCCGDSKCMQKKTMETNLNKYGVISTLQLEEVKEKSRQTLLNNYGVTSPMASEVIQDKFKETNMDRYGFEFPVFNEEVNNKRLQTLMDNHGVSVPMHSIEIKEKQRQTLYENGTAPSSTQQTYICKLVNGELNFPISSLSLDVAFPNEKIYIEFDGSGHDLQVKRGEMTREKFIRNETVRYHMLKRQGWKQIKIKSPYDYLPSDDVLLKEIEKANEWFASDEDGHWHYIVDLGKKMNHEVYGRLRKIKKEDLVEEAEVQASFLFNKEV